MNEPKIHVPSDCGNAPRKDFLSQFNIAFARGEVDFILDHVSDDIVWKMLGSREIKGKAAFEKAIREMASYRTVSLTIQHLITHGKEAAASGVMEMEGEKHYAFCDVYVFTGTSKNMVNQMTSYVVALTDH